MGVLDSNAMKRILCKLLGIELIADTVYSNGVSTARNTEYILWL